MRLPAFRRAPAEYDELFVDTMASAYLERTPWTELRLEAVRSLVDPQPGERVLDLGCAAGAISHFLTCLGCETIGVDAEPLSKNSSPLSLKFVYGPALNCIHTAAESHDDRAATASSPLARYESGSFR